MSTDYESLIQMQMIQKTDTTWLNHNIIWIIRWSEKYVYESIYVCDE